MQGYDHHLVSIRQAELQAEARRHQLAAANTREIPAGPVASETKHRHLRWRGFFPHIAPAGPITRADHP
jgi:hypothetical protein